MDDQDLGVEQYRALAEIRFQIRRFLRFSEDAARRAGIEPQQHQALLALVGMPEGHAATIGALAERLQIRHHSAVELVDRLVQGGLVARSRDPSDQRQVLLSLTPKGRDLVRNLSVSHQIELQRVSPALVQALEALVPTKGLEATDD